MKYSKVQVKEAPDYTVDTKGVVMKGNKTM